jgi:hypothetical protein
VFKAPPGYIKKVRNSRGELVLITELEESEKRAAN